MQRGEVVTCMRILDTAYPGRYKYKTQEAATSAIDLWCDMFRDEDVEVVTLALYRVIEREKSFPPTIGTIKDAIREVICAATGEPTDAELWNILAAAASRAGYEARKEFDKLPPLLKSYVGSPSALHDMGQMEKATFDTVTHGIFLKQLPILRSRREAAKQISPQLAAHIRETAGRLSMPEEPKTLLPEEWNDRRNAILDKLEAAQ